MAGTTQKKKRLLMALGALAVLSTAGCAAWQRLGSREASTAVDSEAMVPEAPEQRRNAALFDSDLGPDVVDVSLYPPAQRRNYEVFARVCSQCHTLARSINAPHVSRGWWEFYAGKMRVRAVLRNRKLPPDELDAVLDFLEYDSNERKVARAAEFERLRQVLKRRFRESVDQRLERLQNSPQPILDH